MNQGGAADGRLDGEAALTDALRPALTGRVVLVGVGRAESGDDGFGPEVIRLLRGRTDATLIDAGVAPENILGQVVAARPQTVLFVDAADMAAAPGALALLAVDDQTAPGTHGLSLQILVQFIMAQARCRSHLLAVEPAPGAGPALSPAVRAAAEAVAAAVAALRPAGRT